MGNGKKCPLMSAQAAHTVCACFDTSLVSGDEIHSRLSMDINSKTIFIHCFVESPAKRSTASMWRKETHLDAIFNGWATQKGQNRFVSILPYCGSHYARSIELIFIWYWAKVKIFLGIDEISLRSSLSWLEMHFFDPICTRFHQSSCLKQCEQDAQTYKLHAWLVLGLLGQISACCINKQMALAFGDGRHEIDKKFGSHEAASSSRFHN